MQPIETTRTAGHGSKSDRQREEAIIALLSQNNVAEAARAAGIGATTLFRWLKEPEFDAAYREARRLAFSQSIARLQQASGPAVTTLLKVMADPKTPAATKVKAASIVLDQGAKTIEIEDIQVKLAALDRIAKAKGPKK